VLSALVLLLAAALSGCAAVTPGTRGSSGAIAWQATDFSRDAAGRYNFTLVLRETAGVGVRFTRLAYQAPGASSESRQVAWRLPAGGELRQPFSAAALVCAREVDCADPASHVPLTLELSGTDDGGRPVRLTLGIRLPAGAGATETAALTPAPPPERTVPARTAVPIQVLNNTVLVPATLNDTQGVTLLLDTGAQRTILTPESARRAGLAVPAGAARRTVAVAGGGRIEVPFLTLRRLQVGDYVLDNVEVGVYPVAPGARLLDGVLGMDVLGRFVFTVDHQARQLRLERR
jgi:clan AA aspartic protease (TIGR02281 family)